MSRTWDHFDRLGDLLQDVCGVSPGAPPGAEGAAAEGRSGGMGPDPRDMGRDVGRGTASGSRDVSRLLAVRWPLIVGKELAFHTDPVQLRQGRLVVSTSSPAWAQTLQLMADVVIAGINEHLGPGTVERVVFRHAGWEEKTPRPTPRLAVPSDGQMPAPASGSAPLSGSAPACRREALGPNAHLPKGGGSRDALAEPEESPVPSVEEEAAIIGVTQADLAPELRAAIMRAVKASYRRG